MTGACVFRATAVGGVVCQGDVTRVETRAEPSAAGVREGAIFVSVPEDFASAELSVLVSALRTNAVLSNELAVTPSIRSAATALRSVEGEEVPCIWSPVLHFMASRSSVNYDQRMPRRFS